MISVDCEVTKVGEIQTRGNFTFRNIQVYYGNSENPIFCLKKPLCNEWDLEVGDQVRIYFEIKAPKGYNNLYVEKYCKLNHLYDCTPKTVNQPDDTEDIRLDDESERALDMIFDSPQGKEASIKEAQRQEMIAKVNPILQQKLQADTEENKQTPAVYDHELNTKSIANDPDNAFMEMNDNTAAAVSFNKNTESNNAFVEINDNTRSVCSKKESNDKEIAPLVQAYNNKSLIGFF